jgi:hypothetical protein
VGEGRAERGRRRWRGDGFGGVDQIGADSSGAGWMLAWRAPGSSSALTLCAEPLSAAAGAGQRRARSLRARLFVTEPLGLRPLSQIYSRTLTLHGPHRKSAR